MLVLNEKNEKAVGLACEFLRAGKVISFPTDTIYAFAVEASNSKAVEDLYKIKNRDEKKPIAIFVRDLDAAKKIFVFDEKAEEIANKFLPGALTLILETRSEASYLLAPNLNKNQDKSLGFRIVDSFFVSELFKKFSGILAVTSANLSGEKSATSSDEIKNNFPHLDLLIEGELFYKSASTVAKIANNEVTILRSGPINL
ncbi:MAG: threonylcarbamoyl-AMP synthase [Proteobacteria bacterium]|nr:threonylcarbamoyl-AMP synthase [Pseudomonadota bacterium]